MIVGRDISAVEVSFGTFRVCLRTASNECALHDNCWRKSHARRRAIVMPEQEMKLVYEGGREYLAIADIYFMFLKCTVCRGLRQNISTYILVLARLLLVGV